MLTRKYSKCKDKSVCLGVVASRHPRRGALYSANSLPSHPKPHRILSFAHAHPLSPLESYRFENMGEGASAFKPANLCSSFRAIPFVFTFFRTLLHSAKTQLSSFQAIPHSA